MASHSESLATRSSDNGSMSSLACCYVFRLWFRGGVAGKIARQHAKLARDEEEQRRLTEAETALRRRTVPDLLWNINNVIHASDTLELDPGTVEPDHFRSLCEARLPA